jgi:hypothetical protein
MWPRQAARWVLFFEFELAGWRKGLLFVLLLFDGRTAPLHPSPVRKILNSHHSPTTPTAHPRILPGLVQCPGS